MTKYKKLFNQNVRRQRFIRLACARRVQSFMHGNFKIQELLKTSKKRQTFKSGRQSREMQYVYHTLARLEQIKKLETGAGQQRIKPHHLVTHNICTLGQCPGSEKTIVRPETDGRSSAFSALISTVAVKRRFYSFLKAEFHLQKSRLLRLSRLKYTQWIFLHLR